MVISSWAARVSSDVVLMTEYRSGKEPSFETVRGLVTLSPGAMPPNDRIALPGEVEMSTLPGVMSHDETGFAERTWMNARVTPTMKMPLNVSPNTPRRRYIEWLGLSHFSTPSSSGLALGVSILTSKPVVVDGCLNGRMIPTDTVGTGGKKEGHPTDRATGGVA